MSKYRVKFTKEGAAVYISHLDLMRTMHRAFIRAGLRVKHSEGYNPHPKMVFAMPLSVGTESQCELLDFELDSDVFTVKIPDMLNAFLPDGIVMTDCWMAETKFSEIAWLNVRGRFEYDDRSACEKASLLSEFFSAPEIVIRKRTKRGETSFDMRPYLRDIDFSAPDRHTIDVSAIVAAGDKVLNPDLIVSALEQLAPELSPDFARFRRIVMYKVGDKNEIVEFR